MLRDWLDPSIPTGGSSDTVDHAPSLVRNDRDPFEQTFGASLRIITDLAAPRNSRMIITPGQSGNPLSGHFADLLPTLARFRPADPWLAPPRQLSTWCPRMNDLPVTIADIRDAAAAIAGAIAHTPTLAAPALSELAGCDIHLKLETLHRTGSFKERGALNKLLTLGPAERRAGVVAMSAGNHAQGVAYHARRLGIPATIVMPEGTPFIKIDRTEAFGAQIVLKGDSLVAARRAAEALARENGLVLVHPYDDPAVIAGQGTIALELLADRPDLDMIVAPIGGGGLISGIAVAAKAVKPEIAIVGVQSTLYPSMYRLMRGEEPGPPAAAATLAEGIAVKEPGRLTRRIVKALVDDILLVDDMMVEGGGADLARSAKAGGRRRRRRRARRRPRRPRAICRQTGRDRHLRRQYRCAAAGLDPDARVGARRAFCPAARRIARPPGRPVADLGGDRQPCRQHRRGPPSAAVPRYVGQTRRAGRRRRDPNRRHVEVLIAALNEAGFPTRLLSGAADEIE